MISRSKNNIPPVSSSESADIMKTLTNDESSLSRSKEEEEEEEEEEALFTDAGDMLKRIRSIPIGSYRDIQKIKRLNFDADKRIIDMASGKVPRNIDNYNELMLAQAARGQHRAAIRSYERLRLDRITPNELTFLALLQSCREAKDVDAARSIVDSLEAVDGVAVTDSMWAVLGQTYVRCGRLQDALTLHERLCAEAQHRHDVYVGNDDERPIVTWNEPLTTAILAGCVRDGSGVMLRKAWSVFDEFRCGHGHPSSYMLTTMIHACGVTGEAERALSLFEEFDIDQDEDPSQATFVGVMRACARSRYFNQETFTYFDRMLARGYDPNAQAMTTLLDACALTGDVARAQKIWDAISLHPAVEHSVHTFTAMLNVYARGQRPRKPTHDHWSPPALRNDRRGLPIGQTLLRDADEDVRLEHIEEESTGRQSLLFQKYDPYDYARRTGDWDSHPSLYDDVDDGSGGEDDDVSLKPLVDGDSDESELDKESDSALSELNSIAPDTPNLVASAAATSDTNAMSSSFSALLDLGDASSVATHDLDEDFGRRQTRHIAESNELFRSMVEDHGITPDAPVLNALVKVHSEALRLKQAERCMELFEAHGVEPDRFTYGSMLSMYARSRRVERALELHRDMRAKQLPLTGHVYGQLIHACAIKGDKANLKRGLSLLREMADHSPPLQTRERFLREIRQRCYRLNDEQTEGFDDEALSVLPPHPSEIMKRPETKKARRTGSRKVRRRLTRLSGMSAARRTTN